MFESAEIGHKISKSEYEAQESTLRIQLLEIQEELKNASFPVIILIGGVDGAGKGETVNLLHEWIDPRHLETHAFGAASDEERERPEAWRFWRVLPPKGKIGILFGSWYTHPIIDRVYGKTKIADLDVALMRINSFEKELVDDGALIIKFWFHLSKQAQSDRLKALMKNPETRWRVTDVDWQHFKLYDKFRRTSEHAIRTTSTGEAPWIIVEGSDKRYRSITVGKHILNLISKRLATDNTQETKISPPPTLIENPYTILDTLDLEQSLSEEEYKRLLEKYQGRLNLLFRQAKSIGKSIILVFEGWDAAGKGGIIRRITSALDARDYQVIPIAAPTDEERSHHYLWRFWRHLPRAGRVTIFDRSWYGRVLVERVEGFASEPEWMRAYNEIVNFEQQLQDHGTLVLKFWVHIDPDEQLRRFQLRQETPYKHYKITDEDFRNRAKWNDYELAANEMIERTSTEFAPWYMVEANDKKFARIKVVKTLCDRLKKSL
ncbi:polyphosphate:AMP phosphotransferase [Pseudanabaena mucicola]|uniref:Polyphosphate:AMP phosphotransferase n=1 Tax=Pseudanabaena mucicola FACHB-723 TaxID=2692860 RepID=A0ABR7ZZY2_9CYAN|nr:polyphosphate:AMP phosphotransferase [Pseudanabaena mucicola]MBD2189424.1 polyphosphate:AMP phosphotransferase [Pseudanabaena mucicola FACHB-723]